MAEYDNKDIQTTFNEDVELLDEGVIIENEYKNE